MSDTKSVVRSVDGWLRIRPGEQCLIRVPTAETGGIYSVVEIISDPGDATPLHVHRNEDEYFVILEGVARNCVRRSGDGCKAWRRHHVAKATPSCVGQPLGSPAPLLRSNRFPGGVQEAMRVIAAGGVKDLPALAESFGVTVLGPAPF